MTRIALGLAALLASTAAQAQAQFNGNWSVEVITERGECDKAYRYPVVIQNGQVRYGGPEAFNASGSVQASGAVSGAISRGSDRANVTGRLSGNGGSGTWTAQGARSCSGRWQAEKRG